MVHLETKGLLEYSLKFGENCSPPKKTAVRNRRKENMFLKMFVFTIKKIFRTELL
jgi:hypothetical protein